MTTPLIETIARAACKANGENDNCSHYYREEAEIIITALTEAGYAIVPVEPTEAMVEAPAIEADEYYFATQQRANDHVASIYRAMISAAQGGGA